MSIFNDLLFHHGHIANVELARSLAAPTDPARGSEPQSQAGDDGAAQAAPEAKVSPSQARRHSALLSAMTALSPFR